MLSPVSPRLPEPALAAAAAAAAALSFGEGGGGGGGGEATRVGVGMGGFGEAGAAIEAAAGGEACCGRGCWGCWDGAAVRAAAAVGAQAAVAPRPAVVALGAEVSHCAAEATVMAEGARQRARERDAHTINLNLALPSNSVDSFGTNTR